MLWASIGGLAVWLWPLRDGAAEIVLPLGLLLGTAVPVSDVPWSAGLRERVSRAYGGGPRADQRGVFVPEGVRRCRYSRDEVEYVAWDVEAEGKECPDLVLSLRVEGRTTRIYRGPIKSVDLGGECANRLGRGLFLPEGKILRMGRPQA
jgi:hypothetical protein